MSVIMNIPKAREYVKTVTSGTWTIDCYSDGTWEGWALDTINLPHTMYTTLEGTSRLWAATATLSSPPAGFTATNVVANFGGTGTFPSGITASVVFIRTVGPGSVYTAAIAAKADTATWTQTGVALYRAARGTWQ